MNEITFKLTQWDRNELKNIDKVNIIREWEDLLKQLPILNIDTSATIFINNPDHQAIMVGYNKDITESFHIKSQFHYFLYSMNLTIRISWQNLKNYFLH